MLHVVDRNNNGNPSFYIATVFIFPPDNVAVAQLHGDTRFTCASSLSTISSISWYLNDSRVIQGSSIRLDFDEIDEVGTLILLNVTVEMNNTRVTCQVSHIEENVTSSVTTILRLQG